MELNLFMPMGSEPMSTLPMSTTWHWDYHRAIALLADSSGFDALVTVNQLTPEVGDHGEYGRQNLEPITYAAGMLALTKRVRVISTVYSSGINPYFLAKMGATCDQIGNGRWGINLVTGSNQPGYEQAGIPWLEHDQRYEVTEEMLQILCGLWSEGVFSFEGKHYTVRDAICEPRPVTRPWPTIVTSGYSPKARALSSKYADYFFVNGASEILGELISGVNKEAAELGRSVRTMASVFCIWGGTRSEGQAQFDALMAAADMGGLDRRINARRQQVGFSRPDLKELASWMFFGSKPIIGSPADVVDQLIELQGLGVGAVAIVFLNFLEDTGRFAREIFPLLTEAGLHSAGTGVVSTGE